MKNKLLIKFRDKNIILPKKLLFWVICHVLSLWSLVNLNMYVITYKHMFIQFI